MDVTLVIDKIDQNDIEKIEYIKNLIKIKNVKYIISTENKDSDLPDYIKKKISNEKDIKVDTIHFIGVEALLNFKLDIKCKKIITVFDLKTFKDESITEKIESVINKKNFKSAIENIDLVIANSTQLRDELIDLINANPANITVINPGVEKLNNLNLKKDGTIGYFGEFGRYERVNKLIDDFISSALSNKIKLIIYGYVCKNYLKIKQKYEKFGNVIFKDGINCNEMEKTINKFDYFVYPAEYSGFGLQLLECLSCEILCFVYEDAKIPDEVIKYAVKIKKIDDIISFNLDELNKNIKEYSKNIKDEFSTEKFIKAINNIYSSLDEKNNNLQSSL